MATYPQYFQLGQNLPKTVGGPLPIGTPDYIIKMLEAAGVQPAFAYSQARPAPMPVVRAAEAIRSIESSNNYRALGPTIDDPNSMYYGDRAYGAYQVMGKNIGPWTREVLGKEMTPEEFLADRAAQDKVFQAKFGQSFYKHGNLEDAASTWFTGQPLSRGAGRSDTLGTTGSKYVDRFLKALPSEEGDPMDIRNMAALQPAQPQPAQPQQSRMAGLLSDPALLENLALAFNTLRMTPDQNLATVISGRQERRAETATRNRTIEFLRQRGLKDLADAVESGAIDAKTAAAELLKRPDQVKGIAVGNRIVNPVTGQVIYEPTGAAAYDPEKVSAARKEFTSLPQVKSFADQTAAYGRIISSVEDPSPAGDLALIFNFMKVLDPGSVVREGEFATAANAGGVDERVRGLYNRVISGERLTPEQRSDFADRSTRLYGGAQSQYRAIAEQYAKFATSAGLPAEQVIPDFGYSGQMYQRPLEFQRPPAPAGVTDEQWAAAWANMTDDERRQFLSGVRP